MPNNTAESAAPFFQFRPLFLFFSSAFPAEMRRRLLGGQKQQSANKGLLLPLSAIPSSSSNRSGAGGLQNELPSSASSSPPSATLLAYRRSFTAADGPAGSGRAAAATDYSGFLAENKYATIGGHRSKWPPPPPPPPLRAGDEKALNGAGGGGGRPLGRPRSMGAAQMGVKCCGSGGGGGDDNNGGDGQREEAETAFGGMGCLRDLPHPPPLPPHAGANLLMTVGDAKQLHSTTAAQQQQMGQGAPPPPALPMMFQQQPSSHHQQQNNNRNSTGSTNSSQTTSSGFESAKSASSQQLAQSSSSGSCSSSSALQHSTATSVINTTLPATTAAIGSPADPASPSSRLSSAGSSTQGGRSSAYFSLSDGLDSSLGAGGTLTSGSQQRRATNQHGRRGQSQLQQQQQQCPRVNIGEMMAKGIPEPEIFAEWLQRLCLSDYLALFLAQGYDLPTLARATPEDLTTLGITRPEDRKRLSQDIQCWRNVGDHWPTDMAREAPVRDWLAAVGLKQYAEQFEQQGYLSVGELEQLEADDLEDLGVRKLGHIKRLWLALKKLKQAQIRRVDQQMAAAAQQSATAILSPPSILRPCSLASSSSNTASSSSSSSNMATLRRHSQPQQPQQQQQQTPLADEVPHMREAQAQQQQSQANNHHVQFRNSSFGIEVGREEGQPSDKGPPRLNLYRTSQIIAQLPREPPPEFPDDDLPSAYGSHIPPPPAPMPLSPGQFSSSRPALHFASLSQPATPRNVQKLFALPAYGIGGGSFQQHQQQHFPLGQQQQHDQQQGRLQLDQILQGLNGQRLDDGFYSARGTMGRR